MELSQIISTSSASFPYTMISQKIIIEFSLIHGKFASTTVDILPQVIHLHPCAAVAKSQFLSSMADMLHPAIRSMSLDDEGPLVLPDMH